MKVVRVTLILTLLIGMATAVQAVVINGGKGLPHTRAAWVQERGRLTMLGHTRFWGKVADVPLPMEDLERGVTIWNVQGLMNLNYGLGKHFGLSLTPILYQDTQKGPDNDQYPWDTFLSLKIGSFGHQASALKYGAELGVRFPSGALHNVVFEDYTAGTTEMSLNALMSYAYDPLYPEDAFNMHFNLGYIYHNDSGTNLHVGNLKDNPPKEFMYKDRHVVHPSQQLTYALGFVIPTQNFDYGFELYGNAWLQNPPKAAASRENYLYLNAGVTYKANRWFSFLISGDYRLTADTDETVGPESRESLMMPNYNTWRINFGARITLLPVSVFRTTERDILMQKAETRRELFEQIIKERRETESAEEELERIKEERRKAERELERLRKILEGQAEQRQKLQDMREELEPSSP